MIGPALPPHLRKKSEENEENEINIEEDDGDDNYGPALPPALASRRAQVTVAVPAPAPMVQAQEESESDEEVGPRPPSASTSKQEAEDGVREFLAREERRRELAKVCMIVSIVP
jgi:hypothetical protein